MQREHQETVNPAKEQSWGIVTVLGSFILWIFRVQFCDVAKVVIIYRTWFTQN
jgi:hypothetical protein